MSNCCFNGNYILKSTLLNRNMNRNMSSSIKIKKLKKNNSYGK